MVLREGRTKRVFRQAERLAAYYVDPTKLMQYNGSTRFNKTGCRKLCSQSGCPGTPAVLSTHSTQSCSSAIHPPCVVVGGREN